MNTYAFIIGAVFPYLVVPVFIAGMSYRIRTWIKAPQPGKMTLFPVPEKDATFQKVLAEALLFPRLFRGDKILWLFSWLFHAMLALVFLGHIRVFTGFVDRMLAGAGMSPEGINAMSSVAGGAAGIVLMATGILLLLRRITIPRVREITGVPDILAPLLVFAIITTGTWMRFTGHFDLEQTRVWATSLLKFSPVIPQNGMFILHLLLAQTLIVFIPFSKILHFGGIFFTQALIRRS